MNKKISDAAKGGQLQISVGYEMLEASVMVDVVPSALGFIGSSSTTKSREKISKFQCRYSFRMLEWSSLENILILTFNGGTSLSCQSTVLVLTEAFGSNRIRL